MGDRRRDEEYTRWVAARRDRLFRAACVLTGGDRALAEDVVQQTLTRLYVAWPRVTRSDSVDAYAHRCLVNAHLDERRRPWRRERAGLPDASEQTAQAVQLARTAPEDSDDLWRAVAGLAPGQRRVVVLRHVLGLSVDETAAELRCSPGSVKSQTSDALARLRAALTTTGDRSDA